MFLSSELIRSICNLAQLSAHAKRNKAALHSEARGPSLYQLSLKFFEFIQHIFIIVYNRNLEIQKVLAK